MDILLDELNRSAKEMAKIRFERITVLEVECPLGPDSLQKDYIEWLQYNRSSVLNSGRVTREEWKFLARVEPTVREVR